MLISRRQLLSLAATVPTVLALGRVAEAAPVQAGACSFLPVSPSRLAETRASEGPFGFTRIDSHTIRVQVTGRNAVPSNAAAVVLNVTAANAVAAGYVTVYPSGTTLPEASNLNIDRAGQIVANLVTVLLGADGSVDIYSSQPNDIVVDVSGAYVPQSTVVSAGRFVALPTAFRALDTRERGFGVGSGQIESVSVASVVPAAATAVVVNLTVTESNGAGFFTAFAAGATRPLSSSLNADGAGQTRANQAIVPVGSDGTVFGINIFASSGGHLIVDVAGYFTGSAATASAEGLFVPNVPYRALDTRSPGSYGRLQAEWTAEFDYAGRAASQAVVVNLTTTHTRGAGYFTGFPARTARPVASNLNAVAAGQTVANHAILRASTAGVAVFTQRGGHLVVDIAGYFIGSPTATTQINPVDNPDPLASQLPYGLHLPNIGVNAYVVEGVSNPVVDAGLVGHWPDVGLAGENSHVVLFAHRTKHGGVFKNLHLLGPGSELVLESPPQDGRVYHYEFARRDITGSGNSEIFGVGLLAPLPNVSLVACSKTNFLPTDSKHRIVVTFTLVRVDPG